MSFAEHTGPVGLYVPGLYHRLLERECQRAMAPEARLYLVMDADEWTTTKAQADVRATD